MYLAAAVLSRAPRQRAPQFWWLKPVVALVVALVVVTEEERARRSPASASRSTGRANPSGSRPHDSGAPTRSAFRMPTVSPPPGTRALRSYRSTGRSSAPPKPKRSRPSRPDTAAPRLSRRVGPVGGAAVLCARRRRRPRHRLAPPPRPVAGDAREPRLAGRPGGDVARDPQGRGAAGRHLRCDRHARARRSAAT